MIYLSRYFNSMCNQCKQYQTIADREELAQDMVESFPEFALSTINRRNLLPKLFAWIGGSVTSFCPARQCNGPEYQKYIEDQAKFYPPDVGVAIGKNRMPHVPGIPDKPTRVGHMGSVGPDNRRVEHDGTVYAYPNLTRTDAPSQNFIQKTISEMGWLQDQAPSGPRASAA